MKERYGTLSETMNALKKEGYIKDFNIINQCLECKDTNEILSPADFMIDKVYRFEGASNPDDQSILYARSYRKFSLKGVLVNGYGISAAGETDALIAGLRTHLE